MSPERRFWWFLVGVALLVATLFVASVVRGQTLRSDCGFACGAGSSVSEALGP